MPPVESINRTYSGGCHCRAVRFEVEASQPIEALDCNCSICAMTGFLHLIVPASHFRLLAGREKLTPYSFETGVAKHLFCKNCGIKTFYVPRSNPDGFSVNARCLDGFPELPLHVEPFDGRHWDAAQALHTHSLEKTEK